MAPARGLPSEALAKGGGKAERVGFQHSGSCSGFALLRFFRGLPPGRRFPIWIFLTTKATTKAVAGSCLAGQVVLNLYATALVCRKPAKNKGS